MIFLVIIHAVSFLQSQERKYAHLLVKEMAVLCTTYILSFAKIKEDMSLDVSYVAPKFTKTVLTSAKNDESNEKCRLYSCRCINLQLTMVSTVFSTHIRGLF